MSIKNIKLVLLILSLASCINIAAPNITYADTTVYITKTGSKYHAHKCGNGNYTTTSKSEAEKRGLEPCKKCWTGSENKKDKVTSSTSNESTKSSIDGNIAGTYYGEDGSILVLCSDGKAEYFYEDYKKVDKKCNWELKKNKVKIYIDSLDCNVYFTKKNDLSNVKIKSKDSNWDDEKYSKISNDSKMLTKKECKKLLKDNK